jgi:glucose-6-phosphate dehydrogenase assembly protein OpcA
MQMQAQLQVQVRVQSQAQAQAQVQAQVQVKVQVQVEEEVEVHTSSPRPHHGRRPREVKAVVLPLLFAASPAQVLLWMGRNAASGEQQQQAPPTAR